VNRSRSVPLQVRILWASGFVLGAGGPAVDEIVGVVGDVKQTSLAATEPRLYVATTPWLWVDNPMWLVSAREAIRLLWLPHSDGRSGRWTGQPIVRVAAMDALSPASEPSDAWR